MNPEINLTRAPWWRSIALIGLVLMLSILMSSVVQKALCGGQILSVLQITPLDDFEPSGPIGGPFTPSFKYYQLTNSGPNSIYWGADKTVDWLDLDPTWGLLEPNESTIVTVSLNTIAETLPEGLHTDTVTFTDISNGVEQTRGVSLTVTSLPPGVLEVTPLDDFEPSGEMGGPFTPSSKEYHLSNIGDSQLTWGAAVTEDWLDLDLTWGELEPNESTVVTVSLNSEADTLPVGIYTDTITFTDMTNIVELTRDVILNVTEPGGLWVVPGSFDVNTVEGCIVTETLTIGNNNPFDLDFMIRTRQVGGTEDLATRTQPFLQTDKGSAFSRPGGRDFTVLDDTPYKPGELIVRFAGKANGRAPDLAERNQILASLGGGSIKHDFKIVPGLSVVELPEGLTVKDALKTFNRGRGILYAEANYEVKICSTFPDDPRFDDLWGMHNTGQTGGTYDADIDAPEAWDIGTGSGEIVVAVIDTGVDYTHPDLVANMWTNDAELNGIPGEDDDGNGYVDDIYGYDFCNYDPDPKDDHYHGTHCSGTIGGVGNNGEGVAGVCWDVRIMALKFLSSSGSGWTDDAIKCVEYSTLMGANLSSNSWGGGSYNQGLKDAIDAAGAAGMLFVASAGNSDSNNDIYPHYPSSYDSESIIAVMATDKYDNKASFSCYGPVSVDLGAPGVDILSCQLGGGYKYASGTSMSGPHVAGACALLWSMNPDMGNDEVKDILLQTVDPTLTGLCVSEGRLNLYNAILETKAPWIEIYPEVGTIVSGQSVDVSVTFDAIELTPGVYQAEIVIFSDDPAGPTVVPVTMTVSADDLQVVPVEGFESSGPKWGPFEPNCTSYTLTNISGVPVDWSGVPVDWTQNWFELSQYEGTLGPYESIEVDVCISPDADLLEPNIYTDTLIFQNLDSNSIKPRVISLTVKPPDCFTEFLDSSRSLSKFSFTFSPDGSSAYYEACREKVSEFPTDPNGGVYVSLWDDDFVEIILANDANVLFYGQSYDRIYIGSNGYITFGQGDIEYYASLESHFNLPRISALFADLTPQDDQSISYKQLDDRIAITFENVPLFGDKDAKNSFQVEMFFVDGSICITWLNIAAVEAVAGLSEGKGIPVLFIESDLSEYAPCWPRGDIDRDYFIGLADLHIFVLHWLEADCCIPYWCQKTDLDFSSAVDFVDFDILAGNWHTRYDWWLKPVSHWRFDEGSGTTAHDSEGINHGTLQGDPTWVTGKVGSYALDFDGSGDCVRVPDDSSLDPTSFTISAWVYANGTPDDYDTIVSKTDGNIFGYIMRINQNKKLHTNVRVAAGTSSAVEAPDVFPIDQWVFVAWSYDSTSTKIYINDSMVAEAPGGGQDASSGKDFLIGLMNETGRYFNGSIDDVRIYDRVLSDEEILELYGEGFRQAFAPSPSDGQKGVDPNVVLSWAPGKDAFSHDVYLGTNFDDVNDADPNAPEYMGNYDSNSYDPNGLEPETTYYWRIDENNPLGTVKGDVWSFTTFKPDPVSRWRFDEGSGTTAYDSEGGNHGTLEGDPTWVAGKVGSYALDFDGSGDYVRVPDDSSLDPTSFTLSTWLYADGTPDNLDTILDKTDENIFGYVLRIGPNGKLQTNVRVAAGTSSSVEAPDVFPTDQWVFVAWSYDSTSTKIYINGLMVNEAPGGGQDSSSGKDFIIGSRRGTDRFFNGTIDDVRIYERVLSDDEIWELYQEGLN